MRRMWNGVIAAAVMICRESGSHATRCWRKQDSNPRSRFRHSPSWDRLLSSPRSFAPSPSPKRNHPFATGDRGFESISLQRRVVRTSVQTSKPRAGRCVRPHRHPHCRPRHRCRRGVARHQFRSAKRNIGNPGHSGCPEPEAAPAATPLCCNSSLISRAVSSRSA